MTRCFRVVDLWVSIFILFFSSLLQYVSIGCRISCRHVLQTNFWLFFFVQHQILCVPISKPGSLCLSFPPDHARLEKLAATWSYRSSLVLPCHLCRPNTFPRYRRGSHSRSRTRAFACSYSSRIRPYRCAGGQLGEVPPLKVNPWSLTFAQLGACPLFIQLQLKSAGQAAGVRNPTKDVTAQHYLSKCNLYGGSLALNLTSNTCGPDRHTLAHF